jgi:uncharacterized membrane protein
MDRIKSFLKSTVTGGLLVVLPMAIFIFALKWIYGLVSGLISPLADRFPVDRGYQEVLVNGLVVFLILLVCFLVGVFVRTKLGMILYHQLETGLLKRAPGYSLIKDTVSQFLGAKKSPFSSVALAKIYGNETLVTCFVTDTHDDSSTVFVPTGPNPTSGNIFHLKTEYVYPLDVKVEDAMRTIISCGAGSELLLEAYRKKLAEADASKTPGD